MRTDKEKVLDLYKKHLGTRDFKGVIIRGADHSFGGYEEKVTQLVKEWVVLEPVGKVHIRL